MRVAGHLESWFVKEASLKDRLEKMINGLWEQMVIAPLVRLVEESAPEADPTPGNIIPFKGRMSA
tara:strand:- start:375 stop:569 length:195 start_codon:yes stop_codon:yes gene_type:complete